jgi:hypothetical protein
MRAPLPEGRRDIIGTNSKLEPIQKKGFVPIGWDAGFILLERSRIAATYFIFIGLPRSGNVVVIMATCMRMHVYACPVRWSSTT